MTGTELNPNSLDIPDIHIGESLNSVREFGPFHLVTLWHSLEHMRDALQTLVDIRSVMVDNAVLLIAVPDFGSLQARVFARSWVHLDVPRHIFHFTNTSLARLLERAGFQVIRRWHQELEYDLMGWSQSALNRVLPAPNVLFRLLTGQPVRAAEEAHWEGGRTTCDVADRFSDNAPPGLLAVTGLDEAEQVSRC